MNRTWSYSSISLFQQCPRKYHRLRVVKDIVEPPQDHLIYGSAVHKAAEEYLRDGTPIPEKFSYIEPKIAPFKKMPGILLCEHEMGVTRNLDPCGFRDKNVWFRGIADLLIINGDKARVADWKTSKSSRYADRKQLELLSLLVFKHFPEVRSVSAGLVFLVADDLVTAKYSREEEGKSWQVWLGEAHLLDEAFNHDVWNPRPNFTCRGWCPVSDCEHNQKRN
jgi:hypothetical protein